MVAASIYRPSSAEVSRAKASYARRSQSYPADDPKVLEAKRAWDTARAVEYVTDLVQGWPKPTDDQLDRIVGILLAAKNGTQE